MKTNTNYRSLALGLLLAVSGAFSTAQAVFIRVTIGYSEFAASQAGGEDNIRAINRVLLAAANTAYNATNTGVVLVHAGFIQVSQPRNGLVLTDPDYAPVRDVARRSNANLIYFLLSGSGAPNLPFPVNPRFSFGNLNNLAIAAGTGASMDAVRRESFNFGGGFSTIMGLGPGQGRTIVPRFSTDGPALFSGFRLGDGTGAFNNTGRIRDRAKITNRQSF